MNIYQATSENVKKAAEIIKKGGVIAAPTDTVYGLSADAYNPEAVKRIYAIKKREMKKPLIIHIANIEDLSKVAEINNEILEVAKKFWPGALTLILNRIEKSPELDLACAGSSKIAVRIPNHPIAMEILRLTKTPLISTSANLSGQPFPKTAQEVYDQLGEKVDMILDNNTNSINQESTIMDMTQTPPQIIRKGAV